MHEPGGSSFWLLVLWLVLVDSFRKPQTLCLGYLSASWGVGLSQYKKVFFICSSVCAQGYLGHLELVCFSCLWAGWVVCHPASIWPVTRKARTTALWSWVVHAGQIATSVSPLNSSSIPWESHIKISILLGYYEPATITMLVLYHNIIIMHPSFVLWAKDTIIVTYIW